MDVDEAGRDDQAPRVDGAPRRPNRAGLDGGDAAVLHGHVCLTTWPIGPIDDHAPTNHDVVHRSVGDRYRVAPRLGDIGRGLAKSAESIIVLELS
jgi:hypothetical protein